MDRSFKVKTIQRSLRGAVLLAGLAFELGIGRPVTIEFGWD
jgi:hypothetical protein